MVRGVAVAALVVAFAMAVEASAAVRVMEILKVVAVAIRINVMWSFTPREIPVNNRSQFSSGTAEFDNCQIVSK
jgi:hypothetical protein